MSGSILMSSHGVAFATAMAVSGTVIILAICRSPKLTLSVSEFPNKSDDPQNLRSCISSEKKKREKKMKKRVHFAEDIVDPIGNCKDFRRDHKKSSSSSSFKKNDQDCGRSQQGKVRGIPPNRLALYNGILRDREHRMTCSY
ncbi:uncharacterized protein LOC113353881 isoform X2 [Papaver somniferum]|uniref:uncharacterized protein LOC113353881 isoform X2 n=1 Tax=Papaver somniferum TaxID=3469 RepID=UPI000E70490F|nr:uncharacterized protein LOC113353881 isoform X2 [Papaver somniferum]